MMKRAFIDELEKIGASVKGLNGISKSRSGRRSIRVDTLLKKDRDGLHKRAGSLKDLAGGFTAGLGYGGRLAGKYISAPLDGIDDVTYALNHMSPEYRNRMIGYGIGRTIPPIAASGALLGTGAVLGRLSHLRQEDEEKKAFVVGVEQGPTDPAAAKKGKIKGEVPSRDDAEITRREDGRDSATNVTGPATLFSDTATVGGS